MQYRYVVTFFVAFVPAALSGFTLRNTLMYATAWTVGLWLVDLQRKRGL